MLIERRAVTSTVQHPHLTDPVEAAAKLKRSCSVATRSLPSTTTMPPKSKNRRRSAGHRDESLQYAAQGQGLLAGVATLLCAIVLDRVVQVAERFTTDRIPSQGR